MILNVSETFPELDSEQLEFMRAMPSWQKFQIIEELTLRARGYVEDRLRDHYPQAQAEEIRRRFATVWLGSELAAKVCRPEPDPPTIEIPIKTLWYVPPR